MGLQNFYPVFTNGQVLTSAHLNDLRGYLEPQDRLTRARLTGIGIACGLEPFWSDRGLVLTGGVAVTSAGHLISEPTVLLDRLRPYAPPDDDGEGEGEGPYGPLTRSDSTPVPATELLVAGTVADAAGADPRPIAAEDLDGAVVMLFLESARQDLRSCDINDCSDRGAQLNLTLRRLLVDAADAQAMFDAEQAIAADNVHRAAHPRLALAPLGIEKINPAGAGIADLPGLYDRYLATAAPALTAVRDGLRAAWRAYRPLLADMYPPAAFPGADGPVPDSLFLPALAQVAARPMHLQYLHALAADLVRAHNEFVDAACVFDAACAPAADRFPRHVLLGGVDVPRTGFADAPETLSEAAAFDPTAIRGGAAPEAAPRPFRHYFVPSEALDGTSDTRAALRALFARAVLLAQSFHTGAVAAGPLRLTPSRDGAAPLGARAIPAYAPFDDPGGDLLANWSAPAARRGRLARLPAWQRTPDDLAAHPLRLRRDGDDFYRIEGHVGQPLGSVLADLYDQRQRLGLSFAVDPVYVGTGRDDDAEARARALGAMRRLLLCRLRDLDVVFLVLMAGLFSFLVWLVQRLGRVDAGRAVSATPASPTASADDRMAGAGARVGDLAGEAMANAAASGRFMLSDGGSGLVQPMAIVAARTLRLDPDAERLLRTASETTLGGLRTGALERSDLVRTLSPAATEAGSVAQVFERVRDDAAGADLFARVRVAARDLDIADAPNADAAAERVYPAVALLARSEELMEVASARSLAEFEPERFGTALTGFADAYQAYAARAEIDPDRAGSASAAANAEIVAAAPQVSATSAQFGGAALGAELGARLQAMFEEMTLEGYARANPGLTHRGGVPEGGTFVVLYGDRMALRSALGDVLEALAPALQRVAATLAGGSATDGPRFDIERIVAAFEAGSRPRVTDALDEFTVLGDFCRQGMCCDGACGDDIVRDRVVPPARGAVDFAVPPDLVLAARGRSVDLRGSAALAASGRVSRGAPGGVAFTRADALAAARPAPSVLRGQATITDPETGETRPARWAVLAVVDARTGHEDRRDRLRDGAFNVELPTGSYEVRVYAEDRASETRLVDLAPGETRQLDFAL